MANKLGRYLPRMTALALAALLLLDHGTDALANRSEAAARGGAESGEQTIRIHNEKELAALAESCTLDRWSEGKKVVLCADISLSDGAFVTIPIFGGIFDGGGYTISGYQLKESVYPAGFFGVLSSGAAVKNLNLCGTVAPAGDADTVGGLVGLNEGTISSCTFTGTVCGSGNTGAIAGDGLFVITMQESNTTTDGDFADVAAGDLLGTLPAAIEANTAYKQGYKGNKRYIRAVITKTSGTSIAAGAIFALGHPHDAPVA